MNGSVFPYDVYTLIRDRLGPRDCCLLSMTCKRLYVWYNRFERKFLSLDLTPNKRPEPIVCNPRDWWECPTCGAVLLLKKKRSHLYKTHACTNHIFLYPKKKGSYIACQKCMVLVKDTKYEKHIVRCQGRIEPNRCRKCGGKAHSDELFSQCPLKLHKCFNCERKLPFQLFRRKKQCEICCGDVYKTYSLCISCCGNRCEGCKERPCIFCRDMVDLFAKSPHECKSNASKVAKLVEYECGKKDDFPWKWQGSLTYPGLFKSDTKYVIYHISNVNQIPNMFPMFDLVVYCTILIFLETTYIGSFAGLGDFVWVRSLVLPNVPTHCFNCMCTNEDTWKICPTCGHATYCGNRCQQDDFRYHFANCLE